MLKDRTKRLAYFSKYNEKNKAKRKLYYSGVKEKKKALVRAAKDKPCMDCGNKYHPCQMDFDHRDPALKVRDISKMIGDQGAMSSLLKEMDKCDVICANCHRLRTFAPELILKT